MNEIEIQQELFNLNAVYMLDLLDKSAFKEQIYICNNKTDILSLIKLGKKCILCESQRKDYINQFIDESLQCSIKIEHIREFNTSFIITFPNTTGNQEDAKKLHEKLKENNISCFNICAYNVSINYLDNNNHAEFLDLIKDIKENPAHVAYQKYNIENYLSDFKDNLVKRYTENIFIPTGFDSLDKYTSGGFMPGLCIIGGETGTGKTTFLLQLADYIAQSKPILYFSLEMEKDELISRSISRESFLLCDKQQKNNNYIAQSATNIYSGQFFKYNQQNTFDVSYEKYLSYAKNLFIIEGDFNYTYSTIENSIKEFIINTSLKPCVFIDYLQVIEPEETDKFFSDKALMDRLIKKLKVLSRDLGISIITISSFSRESYRDGKKKEPNLSSFKESGSIEYTSDYCILLKEKKEDSNINNKDQLEKRHLIFTLAKNRKGPRWVDIPIVYYPMYNYMEEDKPTNYQVPKDKKSKQDHQDRKSSKNPIDFDSFVIKTN